MKRDDLLALSLEILSDNSLNTNLSHNKCIKDQTDFDELEIFFSRYNSKYRDNLFSFSSNTFAVKKENKLISKLFENLNALSPTDFEKISALLSSVLNYSNCYATKPTKDEGVDFIADRSDNDYLNTEEVLFGQCKKFNNTLVSVREIRELAGSVTLFKKSEFMNKTSYINITKKIKSHSSLKTIFVTSYFFSKESINLCWNSGIVPIDIIDLLYLFVDGIKEKKVEWSDKNLSTFYKKKFLNDIEKVVLVK